MEEEKQKSMTNTNGIGWGIASLCLGIMSIILLYYIIISVLSGILAVIFGIIAMRKGDQSFGKPGLIVAIISLVITFLLFLFLRVLDVSLFMIPDWYKF